MDILNNHEILINFLKDVTNDIESSTTDKDKMKLIGQFMMEYKFNSVNKNIEPEEKNMKKYLFLGWYIYTFLIN